MLRKIKIIYTIFVGISILGLWIMLFGTSQVPELETAPFSLTLHVLSEVILALSLLMSGYGYIKITKWAPYCFMLSMGLLIYSLINAAGYYGESGNLAMVLMFAILLSIALVLTSLSFLDLMKINKD